MRIGRMGVCLCGSVLALGLWGANPAFAQKKSVAEEILDILRDEGKIDDAKYKALLNKAKAEAEAREAGVEASRRDAVKDVKKSVDWLDRITLFGDIRARGEGFAQEDAPARTRPRIRMRVGAKVKVSDEVEGGVRLASGDPNDPISSNQTLENAFTRKPIALDQAFITVSPGRTFGIDLPWKPLSITAGKFATPLFRPRATITSEMIFDDDLNVEGLNETLTFYEATEGVLRRLQLHAMQWTADEASMSADSYVFGGQLVASTVLLPSTKFTLAFGDYFFSKADRIAQERNGNSALKITNSVILKDGTVVKGGRSFSPDSKNPIRDFLGGFNIFNASGQLDYDTGYARWPLAFFVDFAHNFDAENGDAEAIWAGASIGALKNPGDLAFSVIWGRVETDSVVSVFSYSDFGRDGGTNVQGPFLKIDYLLLPRLTLSLKNHFVSFIDQQSGQSGKTLNRMQVDLVLTF